MGCTGSQKPQQLFEQTRARRHRHGASRLNYCGVDFWRPSEIEASGEFDRAQDSDRILEKTHHRGANRIDSSADNVGHAANPIQDLPTLQIIEQAINREVTSNGSCVSLPELV